MNRMTASAFSLATLLALPACATRGNPVEQQPAPRTAAESAEHSGVNEFGHAMGGAVVGAALGAGIGYYVVYGLGGPALVSMIGTPIVTGGAVVGAVVGMAKAAPPR